ETYIPTTRGVRRPWAANLKTQVGIEGATLGLDATEITDTQTVGTITQTVGTITPTVGTIK
ncbi:MAG: hypothetical protein ACYDCN_15460, partial [Bacteroidia bacterium]